MNKILEDIRSTPQLLLKTFLVVLGIAWLVTLFPREVKFKYEFQKGMPWLHEKLIAPFDFAIYKSVDELQEEERAIRNDHSPYFVRRAEIGEKQLHDFEVSFRAIWDSLHYSDEDGYPEFTQKAELEFGQEVLGEIYRRGLIESHESIDGKGEQFVLNISDQQVSEEYELNEIYLISGAIQFIENQLSENSQFNKTFIETLLAEHLRPNVFYDKTTTDLSLQERLKDISLTYGKVAKDLKIVDQGEVVNDDLFRKLSSLKREYELRSGNMENSAVLIFGQTLIVFICISVLLLFLTIFRKDVINENNRFYFVLLVFVLTVSFSALPSVFDGLDIMALPFCILPILIRTFFDTRLAILTHVIACLLIGFLAPNGFEFVFVQSVTGIAAVYSLVSLRKRSQLLTTSLVIFIVYSATYTGLSILHEGDWASINWRKLQWFGASAIFTLLVYPLIFIFEKMFRFVSDVTLMELSDSNAPLLRDLSSKAPGTFQHSLQVANLAEAGASAIGADPLLVRTGALYHDIGKMLQPQYVIENQLGGHNPHDELAFGASALVIIQHVLDGVQLARKANLPSQIIEFIQTHHGTTHTRFFFVKAQQAGETVNEKDFQYPGPIPFSKETAVLMMADSVEAASKSLKEYSEENIDHLVEGIIENQRKEGQYEEADITFKDISTLKKLFKGMLKNIYHVRIEYPEEE